jgi:hypothetical protein
VEHGRLSNENIKIPRSHDAKAIDGQKENAA